MSALHKSAIYLLILTLAAAPLANSVASCEGRMANDASAGMMMPEAHRAGVVFVDDLSIDDDPSIDVHSEQAETAGDSSSMGCCDTCIAICAVAGGLSIAGASAMVDLARNGQDPLSTTSVDPRQDPHSRSLFRPPISYI